MLKNSAGPLSNSIISGFLMEKGYTDYFTISAVVSEMDSDGLIGVESSYNRTLYTITSDGEDALNFYSDKVSEPVRNDIISYLKDKQVEIDESREVRCRYFSHDSGIWQVRLSLWDGDNIKTDLTFTVDSEKKAKKICAAWNDDAEHINSFIIDKLLSD
ncbi:MAG: DUF4364 family protein [Eubacterium sp.]|nr:DUF4364 family protein [Eubacterium sp.]